MNKGIKKVTALFICASFCLGGAGAAFAKTENSPEQPEQTTVSVVQNTYGEISKDETVYVLAGADGSVQKIVVSDWIQNAMESNEIEDVSELTDIENLKGDESYRMDGDSVKIWDAQGNDIYYQGSIEKEIPVGLTVSYKLDGNSVTAQEIAGKSGKVTIRFDYENRQYEMKQINGKEEKIYVPFAMLTGMILDNDSFRNVTVNNGKCVNDGDRTVVAGLAFPGLQENLGLNPEDLRIPDYVEISADVENFEFGVTVTIAANEVFNELDASKLDSADTVKESLGTMTGAMTQLLDGSSALYDGLCSLLDKSNELVNGITRLADGAKAMKEGANALDGGAAQMQTGLAELSSGLGTLSANSSGLNAGAEQVFDTLLSAAAAQIQAAGIPIPELTVSNYAEVLDGVAAAMSESITSGQASQQITDAVQRINGLKASLDSYNSFYLGLCSYTDGVDFAAGGAAALSSGAESLKAGTEQLKTGADALYDGVLTLKDGVPALIDGITQLRDGSMNLSDGLKKFNEEGIQKLVDLVEGDMGELVSRLRATIDVSKEYRSFSGIGEDMGGQVKFIYRTEEIMMD